MRKGFLKGIDLEQCTHLSNVMRWRWVYFGFEFAMVDDRAIRRTKLREKFAELKSAAIADLERRGYDVRGKTPAQIRLILKRRPTKSKSIASAPSDA